MRRALTLLAVAASLLVALIDSGGALASPAVASPRVSLRFPMGWVSRQLPGGGIVAAATQRDLGATTPSGPELTLRPVPALAPTVTALFAGIHPSSFTGAISVYSTTVDGKHSIYVQRTTAEASGGETTRTIFVSLSPGVEYTFTLEAPASTWSTSNPAFDAILASVKFS